jgi:malonyl-CoA/methylmalonyl-CoA synthetase
MNANFFARLATRFPKDRSKTLIETPDGAEVSVGALLDRAGRITTLLRAAGVSPGDRVAVQVEKSPAAVALYLGCLQAGAVYAPLDQALPPAEVGALVARLAPRLIVCEPDAEWALAPVAAAARAVLYTMGAAGEGRLLPEAAGLPSERVVAARLGGDPATILQVERAGSGRVGAVLSHDNLWADADAIRGHWALTSGEALIHVLPIHAAEGLIASLNPMLAQGGRVILCASFDPEETIGLMARATILNATPAIYARLIANPLLTRRAATSLRFVACGSAELAEGFADDFEGRTGQRILARYCRAETGSCAGEAGEGPRRPGTVGRALPGVSLRIVDAEARLLGPGETGYLEVSGPAVASGYWRDPEQSAAAFGADGYFRTGDLARLWDDGFVTILARGVAGAAEAAMAVRSA